MRATFSWSPAETISLLPSFRLVFGAFDVRMCRVFVWRRLILPVPVLLKRLAAPEWVFNLGMIFSIFGAEASPHPFLPGQTKPLSAISGSSKYTGTPVNELAARGIGGFSRTGA